MNEENHKFNETTLGDYGHTLPIGVPEGKPPKLEKAFAFKPYRTKDEAAIEKLRKKTKHPGWDVVAVLSHMLTHWGGDIEFASKPEKIRRSAIVNAYMTDVLYAYISLRVEALGPIFALRQECPSCSHEWDWEADLRSLEATVAGSMDELEREFVLKHPIEVGEKTYDTVNLGPPTWSAVVGLSQQQRGGSTSDIKLKMITQAVRSVSSSKNKRQPAIALGGAVLDEVTKYDLERMVRVVEQEFPNCDISLSIDCPSCDATTNYPMQWAFDFFFGGSSLPTTT